MSMKTKQEIERLFRLITKKLAIDKVGEIELVEVDCNPTIDPLVFSTVIATFNDKNNLLNQHYFKLAFTSDSFEPRPSQTNPMADETLAAIELYEKVKQYYLDWRRQQCPYKPGDYFWQNGELFVYGHNGEIIRVDTTMVDLAKYSGNSLDAIEKQLAADIMQQYGVPVASPSSGALHAGAGKTVLDVARERGLTAAYGPGAGDWFDPTQDPLAPRLKDMEAQLYGKWGSSTTTSLGTPSHTSANLTPKDYVKKAVEILNKVHKLNITYADAIHVPGNYCLSLAAMEEAEPGWYTCVDLDCELSISNFYNSPQFVDKYAKIPDKIIGDKRIITRIAFLLMSAIKVKESIWNGSDFKITHRAVSYRPKF